MTPATLLALITYTFVSSITPGPNNMMLLASGVNFGFRRTIPHILGILVGFGVLLGAVGLGLGAMLIAYPPMHTGLKVAGGAYLLWLAWKIGSARSLSSGKGEAATPLSFLGAAAFQWVNVKAWVMAVTATALFAMPDRPLFSAAIVAIVAMAVNLPCVSLWAAFGQALRGFLADPARLKWFNIAMGLALAATLWPMMR
ncbi:MAG: LysE family translocator [Rhizobiaceae bacterium]